MADEVRSIEKRWAVGLMALALAMSVPGCGADTFPSASPPGGTAGDPISRVTSRPTSADAPTYATCQDLSQVFESRDENQLSYLPEEHWLIVSPSGTTYKIDLVNDSACIAANPALATFVARFRASQQAGQRAECQATIEQLTTGTPDVGNKPVDPQALRDYAISLCGPLGVPVPASPQSMVSTPQHGRLSECRPDDLAARMDPVGDGASGRMFNYIYVRNVSSHSCRLTGYPRRVTVTEPGRSVVIATMGTFVPVPAAKPLNPGSLAILVIQTKGLCQHDGTTDRQVHQSTYHRVHVSVKGGTFDVRAPGGLHVACGVSTSEFGSQ